MKTILASETMEIPEGVTVQVAAKVVTVEGPRGKLTRNFKHLNLDFQLLEGGRKLQVDAWFGTRRTMAAIRTAISHVQNLITGVTKGYRYKMRFVYAHFPINASITNSNTAIEIRNFLGEKKVPPITPFPFFLLPSTSTYMISSYAQCIFSTPRLHASIDSSQLVAANI